MQMGMKRTYSQADMKGKRPPKKKVYLQKALTPSQTQEVKRIVLSQAESKYAFNNSTYSPGYSGTAVTMHPTTQGSGDQNYLGQSITPTSITLRYGVIGAAADVTNFVRTTIVQWKGGPPTTASVPAQVFDLTGTVSYVFSGFNPRYFDSFRVLYDEVIPLSAQGPACDYRKIRINKSKLRPIRYVDNAGTVSDGSLFFIVGSDSAVAPFPSIEFVYYTWFKDQ